MTTSAVSGASAASPSAANQKVDLAVAAASKALRVQRDQAAAMVSLIEQASTTPDVGRLFSVRA